MMKKAPGPGEQDEGDAHDEPGVAPAHGFHERLQYQREEERAHGKPRGDGRLRETASTHEPLRHHHEGHGDGKAPDAANDAEDEDVAQFAAGDLHVEKRCAEQQDAHQRQDAWAIPGVRPGAHEDPKGRRDDGAHEEREEDERAVPSEFRLHGRHEDAEPPGGQADIERAEHKAKGDDDPAVVEGRAPGERCPHFASPCCEDSPSTGSGRTGWEGSG